MKLERLCQAFAELNFPQASEHAHPERDAVLRIRLLLADLLIDDEFLVDCLSYELKALTTAPRRGLSPFFTLPAIGVRLALGYWPPRGRAAPHEHTAWTISAVCRNRLEVTTYDRAESYRKKCLIERNRFEASAGRVGAIYEPCIHSPSNPTGEWSLSLHVISPRDGELPADDAFEIVGLDRSVQLNNNEIVHPFIAAQCARLRHQCVHVITSVLCSMTIPQAKITLQDCYPLASIGTRRVIARALQKPEQASSEPNILALTHKDLRLSVEKRGELAVLIADTPDGPVQQLSVNGSALDMLTFASANPVFDTRSLPGEMSEEERTGMTAALEATGLFQRVA